MPACPTRWWRCATAPWALVSRASRATAARTSERTTGSSTDRPRLGEGSGRARGAALRHRAHRRENARPLARRRNAARSISSMCAIRDGIRSWPHPRRHLGAGRATRAGDRPVCRHARCPHRAGRRRGGTRGDDRLVAQADGLEGRVRRWPSVPASGDHAMGLAGRPGSRSDPPPELRDRLPKSWRSSSAATKRP